MENNIIYEGLGFTHTNCENDRSFLSITGSTSQIPTETKGTFRFVGSLALKSLATITMVLLVVFTALMYIFPYFQSMQPSFFSLTSYTINASLELEERKIFLNKKVEKEIKGHQKILMGKIPKTPYLVINTTENIFSVHAGNQVLRKGFCSTGSLIILKKSDKEKWAFQTPKGIRTVRSKTKDPVWKKPDWAFVEEGLPIPASNHSSRYDYATLGDYSLGLGNGYLIHGTLYQRLLGMPVTHGCVRLGDDDLEFVFNTLQMGAKVYIY